MCEEVKPSCTFVSAGYYKYTNAKYVCAHPEREDDAPQCRSLPTCLYGRGCPGIQGEAFIEDIDKEFIKKIHKDREYQLR